MNLVKAADDIKNLSDQQLISAGQNPVMIPPYLVLAEMKRREQLRAEFAKAQQQPQLSVAQQVAQNLIQPQPGQSQQGMQQAPPQGIMQAAPPQAQAMAGGGIVGRYGVGGDTADDAQSQANRIMAQMEAMKVKVPEEPKMTSPTSMEEFAKLYPSISIQDKIAAARGLLGNQDYSQYENFLREQMAQARAKKPSVGDALIAAGSAMASNRDNRVGLANLLAQAIGTGSESYRAQQEKAKKDMQTAMLAQVAFNKMRQEDINKQVELASQMASSERGENIVKMQLIESAKQAAYKKLVDARSDAEKLNAQTELRKLEIQLKMLHDEMTRKGDLEKLAYQRGTAFGIAGINAGARGQAKTEREQRDERVRDLAYDAEMYARDWVTNNKQQGKVDPMDLAISNLDNPNFFSSATKDQRVRAKEQLHKMKQAGLREKAMQANINKQTGMMGLGMGQPGVDWGSREEDIAAKYAIPTQ